MPIISQNYRVLYSDDHGASWTAVAYDDSMDNSGKMYDEAQAVQLRNGSVLLNTRSNTLESVRLQSLSNDGGETWPVNYIARGITDTTQGCEGSMIVAGEQQFLYYSGITPSEPSKDRQLLRMYVSTDQGGSWHYFDLIEPYWAAYSQMVAIPARDEIGIIFEWNKYQNITFETIPLKPARTYSAPQTDHECYVNESKLLIDGDRADNPVFDSIMVSSLSECTNACDVRLDLYNRPCVAVEVRGAKCNLMWGCDYAHPYGGVSVYTAHLIDDAPIPVTTGGRKPFNECQGDCAWWQRDNADGGCGNGLRCLRSFQNSPVPPGCIGEPDGTGTDYCYDPRRGKAPEPEPEPDPAETYTLVDSYVDESFFDRFQITPQPKVFNDFLDKNMETAFEKGMISADAQSVYIGADYETVLDSDAEGRAALQLQSFSRYAHGLFIFDASHMPQGCGTWPAFWLLGRDWPNEGEIDIIEGINVQTSDTSTLHTNPECDFDAHQTDADAMTGEWTPTRCALGGNRPYCSASIEANNHLTFGAEFNENGGGVFATEWAADIGIRMWFWTHDSVPLDVQQQNPDPRLWGKPYALWEFGDWCESDWFEDLYIMIDLYFCGWAGTDGSFKSQCGTIAAEFGDGSCEDFVRLNPEYFKDAYWLIHELTVYQRNVTSSAADTPTLENDRFKLVDTLGSTPLTWTEADAYCVEHLGTRLASMHSDAETELALALCSEGALTSVNEFVGCWIGYFSVDGEPWTAADGSTVSYVNWRESAPNNDHGGFADGYGAFLKVNTENSATNWDGSWEDTQNQANAKISRFLCNKMMFERTPNAQCHADIDAIEFEGDSVSNPVWNVGSQTLSQCKELCSIGIDEHGRPCVAIEWADEGGDVPAHETRNCNLAWACDNTPFWGGGSVYIAQTPMPNGICSLSMIMICCCL